MPTQPSQTTRILHPTARRCMTVARVLQLTPDMRRVTFTGEQLQGFVSLAPDDHVKLLFASNAAEQQRLDDFLAGREGERPVTRDYTPRGYDPASNELDIDFVLHGPGVASAWASQACPGQQLHMAGPRSSLVVAEHFASYLLIGDASALPAIARWLEQLPAGKRAVVVMEVADQNERLPLSSAAELELHWVVRGVPPSLLDLVATLQLPSDALYAWAACEANQSRKIRRVLLEHHGLDEQCVRTAGYWRQASA